MPIKSRNVFKGDEKIYNFGNVSAPLIIGFFYVLDGKLLYYVLNPELRREKDQMGRDSLLWITAQSSALIAHKKMHWPSKRRGGNSIG